MTQEWTATLPGRPRRTGRTVVIVLATVLGVCCLGGGTIALIGAARQDQPVGAGSAMGEAPGVTPRLPGLGEPVRDGKFEFVVASVRCGKQSLTNGWLKAEAKGEFCVISLSVRNIGDEARRFADGAQVALGEDGQRYAADTGAGVVANGNGEAVWEVVNPGIAIETKIVYDVPAGASIVSLELHDSGLSGGVTVRVADSP